ncbi:NAD(P)H-binding protein [Amycolatopsis azurea]|uniref:Nucleoside-diphosphate sugar epimerase n=1 Tax=Amycolatopsis azurea DSM 43854 TaxID=1238180 RepID=M2QP10_9PSEU|nr:NAD(P)H-binding protein [Amycolatopsis azurea]EMD27547.1 Oxidoreductase [Amycolatopsis azurea DSM 43854]OOC06372.1 nucleoside-diphosphate sugar epimerase [Amycolatopsis azurea DSM 43854]
MILVLGSTGKIGRELVPALLDKGARVRALTRDPARARIDPRAEVAAGDLDAFDPALLDGVERVFVLTSGHGSDPLSQERTVLKAASGVAHVVKLSTTGVHFGQTDPISLVHTAAEQAVREAGPDWTILRPGTFMDNRFAWLHAVRGDGVIRVPEGDPASALVHVRDIAAVAATVLTTDGHAGKTYPITGGEALTTRRQVEILGDALGRQLTYVEEPEADARARMLGFGWPASAVDGIFELKRQSAGNEKIVFDTVRDLLGRAPLTFDDWAREHAAAFA